MHRSYLILFIVMLNILLAQAQVPQFIVAEFEADKKSLSAVKWKIEGSSYKVTYTDSLQLHYRDVYDSNGILMMHERELVNEKIPQAIYEYCSSYFPGVKTGKVWLLEKNGTGRSYYTIIGDIALFFDEGGNFTGTEGRPMYVTQNE